MRERQFISVLLVCAILGALSFFVFRQRNSGVKLTPLSCTFLKVGKADAIVLESGGRAMVIDTGEEDDGQELVDFLKNRNISLVDVLIITHYDKDHVGGADTLIANIPVARVLIPDYPGSSTEYMDFMAAAKNASIEPEAVNTPLSFPFGDALVKVDPPKSYEIPEGAIEYDNNFSLLATVTHGSNRLLFTGDIEKERINELVSEAQLPECSFIKFPHHGIYNTAQEDLLKLIKPRYSVICSSDKHPAEKKTLELLKKYGVDVLETRHGKITLISDGLKLELHQKVRH